MCAGSLVHLNETEPLLIAPVFQSCVTQEDIMQHVLIRIMNCIVSALLLLCPPSVVVP